MELAVSQTSEKQPIRRLPEPRLWLFLERQQEAALPQLLQRALGLYGQRQEPVKRQLELLRVQVSPARLLRPMLSQRPRSHLKEAPRVDNVVRL